MNDFEKLSGYVPVQYIIWTLAVVIVLVVVIYKCYPTVKGWFETARKAENKRDDIDETLEKHNKELEELRGEIQKINKNCLMTILISIRLKKLQLNNRGTLKRVWKSVSSSSVAYLGLFKGYRRLVPMVQPKRLRKKFRIIW